MKLKPLTLYSYVPLITLGLLSAHGRIEGADTPDCGCSAAAQTAAQGDKGAVPQIPGQTFRVHDPSIAKEGDTYYVFSTGRGITVQTSKDMVTWQLQGRVFPQPVPWTSTTIPGSTDYYWAPDISFFNGKWHLYYSVSTFGKNRSAIGLATNPTLDPKRPDYQWKDEGSVFESNLIDDWNAIDPNLIIDEKGQAWLTFGSFWSGIRMIKLDSKLGIPTEKIAQVCHLASRPRGGEIKGSIEAPFIVRHSGYYYLFASFDFCCRGVRSTYNVRVGRAKKITGPYVDREGKPMLEGGGTMVVSGSGRWHGTGHNAVYHEGKTDWLVYHAYDGEEFGASKLRIEKMSWDAAGWPQVPSMTTAKPAESNL